MPGPNDERPGGALEQRTIAAKTIHDTLGIVRHDVDGRVGGNRGDPQHLELGRGHGERQGNGVIKSWVAVNKEADHGS